MKWWTIILVLLVVACAAAVGWQGLAVDPGYVLVRLGGTRVETTLWFAIAALLLLWLLLSFLGRLLRWPLRTWSRRKHRRGRERIAAGLTALAEGRYSRALRELERASHHAGLRVPALLAAARAAHACGDTERADRILDEVANSAPAAVAALRGRFLLEQGNADAALPLLKAAVHAADGSQNSSPGAARLLAEAALVCADHAAALDALDIVSRDRQLADSAFATLQTRVLVAALGGAATAANLNALWSGLRRAQRAIPEVVAAYARRAAALGLALAALDELESALRRDWSEIVIRAYGDLGEAEADTRLRRAEGWLAAQPNSAGLMLTLGRLCNQSKVWGKAQEYLGRGLAIEPSAALWEALGECCMGQERTADAARCFRNALHIARGDPTEALADAGSGPLNTRASTVEERSEHGVPRLPVSARPGRL
jgi:HemY protein